MAYSEVDRDYIRHYTGFGAIFLQAEPRLENAITATQSLADFGARPDSTTENAIKALIYGAAAVVGTAGVTPGGTSTTGVTFAQPQIRGLLTIEAGIASLDNQLGALGVGRGAVTIDSARETIRLRMEGRRLCHAMATKLGMRGVRADVFSAGAPVLDADPFASDIGPNW